MEDIPERKIVICAEPHGADENALFVGAKIQLEGRSFDLFGITETPTRAFTWEQFLSKINPAELAAAWSEGIKVMVAAALKRDYDDNYHVVSSLRGDKAFRLFVSRVVTYYSGSVEIHIYVVEMKIKDYGDQSTTRLLKAISAGLRFRFLILEKQSPFTVANLEYQTVKMKQS